MAKKTPSLHPRDPQPSNEKTLMIKNLPMWVDQGRSRQKHIAAYSDLPSPAITSNGDELRIFNHLVCHRPYCRETLVYLALQKPIQKGNLRNRVQKPRRIKSR
jgi:hypothetical protein